MTNQEKYVVAYRLTSVASTGLSFIEDYLMKNFKTDAASLRFLYILLSYNAELILKSRIVMIGEFINKNEIYSKLKRLSHGIIEINDFLGKNELERLGIKEIAKQNNKYKIVTLDKNEAIIEDFTDIRYDFFDGKMRKTDTQEHRRIKGYIDVLFSILSRVKDENLKEKMLCLNKKKKN